MKIFNYIALLLGIIIAGHSSSLAQTTLKGNGEVFYHHTFDWENPDNPKGWAASEGFYFEDPQDKGFNWHWYPNDSLIAQYTNEPPFQSSSPEDGHLCLFLNRYNNYVDPAELSEESHLVNNAVVFPSFDCSDKSSVIVSFETNFMPFSKTTGMEMYISNNYGMHWAVWELGFGCDHKERPNGVNPGEAAIFEANISDIAAGMPNVIIKINWCCVNNYFWIIDDFKLAEAFDYDLRMLYYTLEWQDDIEPGEYPYSEESYTYNIPISQLGGSYFNFETGFVNFGEFDLYEVCLDVDISKNNQSIWHHTTEPEWIPTSVVDTAIIVEKFTPTEFGHYKVNYELNHEETDQTPVDNRAEVFFNVTDSIYSRCDNTAEESFSWGYYDAGIEGEPNEQIFIGSVFPIYGDTKIQSVSVYVVGGLADGQIEFRGALSKLRPKEEDFYGQNPIELLVSETVVLDSSMFNTWVTLPFDHDGESEFLHEGEFYYAGIEYWNYHTENIPFRKYQNLAIGSDKGVKLKDPVARFESVTQDGYFWWGAASDKNPMVRMILNDHSNIIDGIPLEKSVTQLYQNHPNPAKDVTRIEYELVNHSEAKIEITDMTGRTVLSFYESYLSAGRHSTTVNTNNLESGIYFYTLNTGTFVHTKRMIVSK